jgi:hypothetical protein
MSTCVQVSRTGLDWPVGMPHARISLPIGLLRCIQTERSPAQNLNYTEMLILKVPTGRFLLAASLICFVSPLSFAQAPSGEAVIHDSQSQITGTWRGNSECVLKNSPCRDEINVYRFSEIAGKPGWFSGIGSKLVDGKEISMGTLEWKYDAEKHMLRSENSGATFRLVVDGSTIEGSLTLADNTVYRRIHLKKD